MTNQARILDKVDDAELIEQLREIAPARETVGADRCHTRVPGNVSYQSCSRPPGHDGVHITWEWETRNGQRRVPTHPLGYWVDD